MDYEGASLAGYTEENVNQQREIDHHQRHCGRCMRDEECPVLERLWNQLNKES